VSCAVSWVIWAKPTPYRINKPSNAATMAAEARSAASDVFVPKIDTMRDISPSVCRAGLRPCPNECPPDGARPGGWQVSWLAGRRFRSCLPGCPVAGPALGPVRNGNSPLTVAGAAAELPVDRAHRSSLFVSREGEPSRATLNEVYWPGQSNARRKTFWKGHCQVWTAGGAGAGSSSDNPPNRNSAMNATRAITANAAITIPAGMELIRRRVISKKAAQAPL